MPIDKEPPQTAIRERHFACLRMHLQAENRHDMAGTLATLSPDCAFEDIPMGRRFDGHEGAREYYELWWSAFAVTVEGTNRSYWLNDNLFVSEAIYHGRHIGPFLGVAATGNAIRLPFVVFVSFTGGAVWRRAFLLRHGYVATADRVIVYWLVRIGRGMNAEIHVTGVTSVTSISPSNAHTIE